ncbi:MAG: 23S rRNA (adenine(1618)-N(6))-methyltransferase RlmF [Bacteriovoracaceae bacterium]|nr:23S rRNA (adenine(1618)-N(6))-methyltransferase RlmF [Bacteriovoracaceae bacterium]
MHPKNRHNDRYDFVSLIQALPALAEFVIPHPKSGDTIDFSNPRAVLCLNEAILIKDYGLTEWFLPKGYLCPPIPGRADYIHHIAELLKNKGGNVRVLDIGVGANCIYPLIGFNEYGWRFVGSEIDEKALAHAKDLLRRNKLNAFIELRLQRNPESIFKNMITPTDRFDLTICNPPFYSSLKEAQDESARKWKHLGLKHSADHRNFGGGGSELFCKGGEAAFLKAMVEESKEFAKQVKWFSSLVSKEGLLDALDAQLEKAGASEMHIIDMEQGQKKSRVVAWKF